MHVTFLDGTDFFSKGANVLFCIVIVKCKVYFVCFRLFVISKVVSILMAVVALRSVWSLSWSVVIGGASTRYYSIINWT